MVLMFSKSSQGCRSEYAGVYRLHQLHVAFDLRGREKALPHVMCSGMTLLCDRDLNTV